MKLAIRQPSLEDLEQLVNLHIEVWKQTYGDLFPADFFNAEHRASRQQMWTQILTNPTPGLRVRIAATPNRIVGFALAGPPSEEEDRKSWPLQLFSLNVDQSFHGGGAGQSLLESVLSDESAMLWVEDTNARAIRFYERNGFRLDGVTLPDATAPNVTDARMVR